MILLLAFYVAKTTTTQSLAIVFTSNYEISQDGTFDYSSSNAGLENYMHNEQEGFDSYDNL
jgi:hypothetical protein